MDLAWTEFATANSSHAINPNLYWDAGKAYLRGWVISYTASYKKNTLTSYRKASSRLRLAQRAISAQDSPENRDEWRKAKCEFDTWADILELTKWAHADATLYKFGNRLGKLLARQRPAQAHSYHCPAGFLKHGQKDTTGGQ